MTKTMGINGLRFNRRVSAGHRAKWEAKKQQRSSDLAILQVIHDMLVNGKHISPNLGVFVRHRSEQNDFEVRKVGTSRLVGHVSRWGVQPC